MWLPLRWTSLAVPSFELGDLPHLVRAPRLRLRCKGNLFAMGLIAISSPRRLHEAFDSLTAKGDLDVLHRHLLLAFAAAAVERSLAKVRESLPA
jgi:hypothetical protein